MNGLDSISSANISKRYAGVSKPKTEITTDKPVKPITSEQARLLVEKQRALEDELPVIEVDTLVFRTSSKEEIEARGVVRCDNPAIDGPGSVRDPRLGPRNRREPCPTCQLNLEKCPGHYGYIVTPPVPIADRDFLQILINTLRCICPNCSCMVVTDDEIEEAGLNKLSFKYRLSGIGDLSAKKRCKKTGDPSNPIKMACCQINSGVIPIYNSVNKMMKADDYVIYYKFTEKEKEWKNHYTPEEYFQILDQISDKDARRLRYDEGSHPRDLVVRALPVIPYIARPDMFQGDHYYKDKIVDLYRDIIKSSNLYFKHETPDNIKKDAIKDVYLSIGKIFRSDNKKGQKGNDSGDIRKKLQDKRKGIIRGYLMGKKTEYNGRSVALPGAFLRVDEIGVPVEMAAKLTVPVVCTAYNQEELQQDYNEGRIINIKPNSGKFKGVKVIVNDLFRNYYPNFQVEVGVEVHRMLRDGDIVLVNRYPSLHKPSIMAGYAKLFNSKGVKINLSLTTPLHADFDGDELNIHVPQTVEAMAEAIHLLNVSNVIMSDETARPMMGIVYDTLLVMYQLTRNEEEEQLRFRENKVYNDFIDTWTQNLIDQGKQIPREQYDQWKKEQSLEFDRLKKQYQDKMKADRDQRALEYAAADTRYMEALDLYRDYVDAEYKLQNAQEKLASLDKEYNTKVERLLKGPKLSSYALELAGFWKENTPIVTQEENVQKMHKLMIKWKDELKKLNDNIAQLKTQVSGPRPDNPDTHPRFAKLRKQVGIIDEILYNTGIMAVADRPQFETLNDRLRANNIPIKSARGVISASFPEGFYYRNKGVVIRNGVLVSGHLSKDTLGTKDGTIIAEMYAHPEFGQKATVDFMSDIQLIANSMSGSMGFSVGITDCMPDNPTEFKQKIDEAVADAKVKVLSLVGKPRNKFEATKQEARIMSALDVAKQVADKEITLSTNPNNAFMAMAHAGSKGTLLNFTQTSSILGQQNVNGARVQNDLPGKRSLAIYDLDDTSIESRGFCTTSFLTGLTAPAFFMHNMAGREGLVNMSVNTSKTGDLQHRIVKAVEDAHALNGSIRDSENYVLQFIYGEDGMNIRDLVPNKIRGKTVKLPFSLDHLINQANEMF